jgi:hypothetical protein
VHAAVSTDVYRGPDRRAASLTLSDYRGPDRRDPLSRHRPLGARIAVFAIALAFLVAVVAHSVVVDSAGRVVTFTDLRDSSAGLLVVAGTILLVVWALTGRAADALDGSAFLLLGAGMLSLAGPWASWLHSNPMIGLLSPGCRLALCLPALVVLISSPLLSPVVSSIRGLHLLSAVAGASLLLFAVLAAIRVPGPMDDRGVWTVIVAVMAVGWLAGAAQRFAVRDATERRDCWVVGTGLAAWGLGDGALAVSLHADLQWAIAGAALQLVAAGLIASFAMKRLMATLGAEVSRRLWLGTELSTVSVHLADSQSERRQLVHDARNVIAAVHGATLTLQRHGEQLSPEVRHQLRQGMGAELSRLQEMLGGADGTNSTIRS